MADADIPKTLSAGLSFPGESADYRAAREALLAAEVELRRHTERVAALRRAPPPGGGGPEDYLFTGDEGPVRLSQLFGEHETLIAYSYMYGPEMERPCPSCTSMLDALEGNAVAISRQVALAIIASSPLERIKAFTEPRGWRRFRLLSSAGNSYNRDYRGEDARGHQQPMLNVFRRRDGAIRHVWASEMLYAPCDPGQDPRHVDMLWPLWSALDCTPDGRGQGFYPKLGDA